ncbi:MAG: UDP-N-acetylglucosamine--N-acetylmuramyl-(pentapeptide) pyrophosphoryl-undecaprenol N-acetylglucosamine transferase [Phycisphaerales bacterium JB065]
MDAPETKIRIAFAGGGSGGHIYPNLAVLESLEEQLGRDGVEASFLVSPRSIDQTIMQEEQRNSVVIPASPVSFRPKGAARLVLGWGKAVRAARQAIRELRADAVVATGGFVSAPVMNAARAERVPFVLLNLDAVAGKANRWIGKRATIHLTTVTGPRVPAAWDAIRPIVRESAKPQGTPAECRERLGLDPERHTLLVTGGSQGARSINHMMARLTHDTPKPFKDWQILHQCGEGESAEQQAAYNRARVDAHCSDYLTDMASAWGAADLAVARCGAGTVAEIWSARVPSVLLPYPYHRDNHQALNAERLSIADAAIIHTDRIDPEANASEAGSTIVELMEDEAARQRMRSAFDTLGPTDGAKQVAERLIALVRC